MKDMRFSALAALPLFFTVGNAVADTGLLGSWSGTFSGVQVEIPVTPGPFGYQSGDTKAVGGPRFIETKLQITFDTQTKGLAAGTWSSGQFSQRFACAQISGTVWNCVDGGGRSTVEVTSASEIKVCYLDSRQGAQGAGCAVMRKAG